MTFLLQAVVLLQNWNDRVLIDGNAVLFAPQESQIKTENKYLVTEQFCGEYCRASAVAGPWKACT